MNSKKILFRIICITTTMLVMLFLCSCNINDEANWQEEMDRERDSINQGRPVGAELIPEPPKDISDVRITAVPRKYDAPSYAEDFHYLSMMQIWYGYCSNGVWYDYPSENYDLAGIWKYEGEKGWQAGIGSHIVEIGPYLLICICIQDNPMIETEIVDTLSTQVIQPLEEYYTYHYYFDEDGKKHFFMDNHGHGYGYIAENPVTLSDSETADCILRCEFPRRYYLLLKSEELTDDYELTVTLASSIPQNEEDYTLSYEMIKDILLSNVK